MGAGETNPQKFELPIACPRELWIGPQFKRNGVVEVGQLPVDFCFGKAGGVQPLLLVGDDPAPIFFSFVGVLSLRVQMPRDRLH